MVSRWGGSPPVAHEAPPAEPWRACSGREGLNLTGASPVVPIARFRHVAIPQCVVGNHTFFAWVLCVVYTARLPRRHRASAVGATGGPSTWGSLNIMA